MVWFRKLLNHLKTLCELPRILVLNLCTLDVEIDNIKLGLGRVLLNNNRSFNSHNLNDYEFKIFSQWGEDGIIQKLISSIEIKNKTFIEFGVEDFSESNCRFLMMNNLWRGFVVDSSRKNIARLKMSHYYWKYDLTAIAEFLTCENINEVLDRSAFDPDVGLLSIDVDGNDFHIFKAITKFRPRILVIEFNSVFGCELKITVPYHKEFIRTAAHYSNLYFGASLPAITTLANEKGYALVGTNSSNCNAFYVRRELLVPTLTEVSPAQAFAPSHFRESRDRDGSLTFVSGSERLNLIRGLPVLDIETRRIREL